jgi:hypothetical protein
MHSRLCTEIAIIVSVAKDAVTGSAAIAATVIAALGLKTWKRQFHGNANYDVARRLLRATYRLRETIRSLRAPFISTGKIIAARKATGQEDASEDRSEAIAYQVRWQKVSDARVQSEAELLEAEALWGTAIRERGDGLVQCLGTLYASIIRWVSRSVPPVDDVETIMAVIHDSGRAVRRFFHQAEFGHREFGVGDEAHLRL